MRRSIVLSLPLQLVFPDPTQSVAGMERQEGGQPFHGRVSMIGVQSHHFHGQMM
jgi:hypothetical protein